MEYVLSIFCHPLYVLLLWETEGGGILLHYEGGRPTQQHRPSKKGTALVSQSLKNKLEYYTTPC